MKRKFGRRIAGMFAAVLIGFAASAHAESAEDEIEQGVDEIQPLINISEIDGTEGMSLEEMTDVFSETAMSEYVDSRTGFSMQYPSLFLFEEGGSGLYARTADQKASLTIDNMENQGSLNEEALIEAIRLELPDAKIEKNEQNGCLRFDRDTDDAAVCQTDLYFLTEHSFHHIVIRYPAEEKGTYSSYIEYMINTMETGESELG